jgi:hypothetical protein
MKRNKSEGDAEKGKMGVYIANKVTQRRKQRLALKEGRRGGLVSTQKTLGLSQRRQLIASLRRPPVYTGTVSSKEPFQL